MVTFLVYHEAHRLLNVECKVAFTVEEGRFSIHLNGFMAEEGCKREQEPHSLHANDWGKCLVEIKSLLAGNSLRRLDVF